MIGLLRSLGLTRWLALGAVVALVGGALWLQTSRVERLQVELALLSQDLATEQARASAATAAVAEAVERAERLAAAQRLAQEKLAERLARVAAAEGQCLDMPLPEGLLE